jgi:tRNA (guanine-N7-)-methyltransferase
LPEAAIDFVYVLFPDPWPKARHQKRRLLQVETIAAFARILKDGGRLRFATDWADYADWTLNLVLRNPDFSWPAQTKDDWTIAPHDHFQTRYETKGLGDCKPVFFDFYRKTR